MEMQLVLVILILCLILMSWLLAIMAQMLRHAKNQTKSLSDEIEQKAIDLAALELSEEQQAGAQRFRDLPTEEQRRMRTTVNQRLQMQEISERIRRLELTQKLNQDPRMQELFKQLSAQNFEDPLEE